MVRLLHITEVPAGEAPLWVRERWVGVTVQLSQRRSSPRSWATTGVLSGPKGALSCLVAFFTGKLSRESGYVVAVQHAIDALAERNPDAAAWWRTHTPHLLRPGRYFVFQPGVGHVTESPEP